MSALSHTTLGSTITREELLALDPETLRGATITGVCWAVEAPLGEPYRPSDLLPELPDGAACTIEDSNLDNVRIPTGYLLVRCSCRRIQVQSDLEDWEIGEDGLPLRPVRWREYEELGLSTDPADLPSEPLEDSAVSLAWRARWDDGSA